MTSFEIGQQVCGEDVLMVGYIEAPRRGVRERNELPQEKRILYKVEPSGKPVPRPIEKQGQAKPQEVNTNEAAKEDEDLRAGRRVRSRSERLKLSRGRRGSSPRPTEGEVICHLRFHRV